MSSPDPIVTGRHRPAARAVVDVAAVPPRLPARAPPHVRGRRPVAARRPARRAARALAQAARRGGARRRSHARASGPPSGSASPPRRTWFLRTVSTRVQRRFRDKVTIALESHVARLQAAVATIAHQERPELLDRLSVLRDQVFVLDHMYMSVFSTAGWILRLVVTVVLLASVHPALLLLAALRRAHRGHLGLATGGRAGRRGGGGTGPTSGPAPVHDGHHRAAGQGGAGHRHRTPPGRAAPGRVGASGTARCPRPGGGRRCGTAWPGRSSASPTWAASCSWPPASTHRPGDVLLVLAAGARLSSYIGATVGEIGFLRGIWMDGSQRLAWLEDYAAAVGLHGRSAGARRAARGDHLRGRVLRLPRHRSPRARGRHRSRCPPARWWRSWGRTGPGKTTLVKLLAKLYEPTSGRILVDGAELARMPAEGWRTRLAGAFQDFFRFELRRLASSVGLGDVPRMDDEPRRGRRRRPGRGRRRHRAPRRRARHAARPDLARRRRGELRPVAEAGPGPRLHAGRAARARARRADRRARRRDRARPVRALRGRRPARGPIRAASRSWCRTASRTVRMADLIVVLDGAHVVEVGTHDDLMSRKGGQYAELYDIQAAAYR